MSDVVGGTARASGWPAPRGLVIGFVAGLVLATSPVLGLGLVALELAWIRSVRARGPAWHDFARRVTVFAVAGLLLALALPFSMLVLFSTS